MKVENGSALYFHGLNRGTKYDLIRADDRAAVPATTVLKLVVERMTGKRRM